MKNIRDFTQTQKIITERYRHFDKTESFNPAELFLNHGKYLPKPRGFDLSNFTEKFLETIKVSQQPEAQIDNYENHLVGIVYKRKSFLGFSTGKDTLFISETPDYVVFAHKSDVKSGFFSKSNSKKPAFSKAFQEHIKNEQDLLSPANDSMTSNVLTKDLSSFDMLSIRSLSEENELILAALPMHSAKGLDEETNELHIKKYYYILSDKDAALAGFNAMGALVYIKELNEINLKSEGFWFMKTIRFGDISMKPGKHGRKYFKAIRKLNLADSETRIKEVISINSQKGAHQAADILMQLLARQTGDNLYELFRLFADFIRHKAIFPDQKHRDALFNATKQALSGLMNIEKYRFFLTRYNFSFKDKAVFLNLILHTANNIDAFINGLPVAEFIHSEFMKQCKSSDRKLIVNIIFAKYLVKANEISKAKKLISKIQKSVPEEELSLLMPDKDTDLSTPEGGKYLLTELYDMLYAIKDKNSKSYLKLSAELQPLNINRLEALAESDADTAQRATHILNLIKDADLSSEEKTPLPAKYKSIKSKSEILKHPAERKSGSMSYINRWLSNNTKGEFTSVKSFSEMIKSENNPDITESIRSMAQAMGLEKIELYSADGAIKNEIVGYPGNPPFLVIGKSLLSKPTEIIAVLAARELAHIAHGHAPVTAKDIWRSFARNGQMSLDNFANTLTTAGLVGKSLTDIERISNVTGALSQSVCLDGSPEKKEEAESALYHFLNKPLNFSKHNKDNQRLILAGRLLSVSADRAGLLFAPSLSVAVKALLFFFQQDADKTFEATSVKEVLETKNNDGSYRHPELVIRIMNLFAFYLSDDYNSLQKAVKK